MEPEQFFLSPTSDFRISRARARAYASSLTSTLVAWCRVTGAGSRAAERVLRTLGGEEQVRQQHAATWAQAGVPVIDNSEYVAENFTGLLLDLAREDRLPAIVFNFERRACMRLAAVAADVLGSLETTARAEQASREEALGGGRPRDHKPDRPRRAIRDERLTRAEAQDLLEDGAWDESSDEDEDQPDQAFTFVRAGDRGRVGAEKLEKLLKDVASYARDNDDSRRMLWRALLRGVGVHHAGKRPGPSPFIKGLAGAGSERNVVVSCFGTGLKFGVGLESLDNL